MWGELKIFKPLGVTDMSFAVNQVIGNCECLGIIDKPISKDVGIGVTFYKHLITCYSSLVQLLSRPCKSTLTVWDRMAMLREIDRLQVENAALVEELHQVRAAADMYRQVLTRLAEKDRSTSSIRHAAIR